MAGGEFVVKLEHWELVGVYFVSLVWAPWEVLVAWVLLSFWHKSFLCSIGNILGCKPLSPPYASRYRLSGVLDSAADGVCNRCPPSTKE